MIAAFGDLQVRVVSRRQPDALRRHEIAERIVRLRQVRMHGAHHVLRRMRPGYCEHLRMRLADDVGLRAEAAGDDHLSVLFERLADRIERFLHRRVDEPARVHDDDFGVLVSRRDQIPLRAQLREDALGVDQRFGTAEGDETDFGRWSRGSREGAQGRTGLPSDRAANARVKPPQPFVSPPPLSLSDGGLAAGAPKFGKGKLPKRLRVCCWSCCCMSMNALALCSR